MLTRLTLFLAALSAFVALIAVPASAEWCGTTTTAVPPSNTALPTISDQQLIWSTGMESGTLNDWYSPESGPSGNYGGGEYNSGSGDTIPSSTFAHSGLWSMKMTLSNGTGGTRLFRWRELRQNREIIASAWYFIPTAYSLVGPNVYNLLFQYKSRSSTSVDPIWGVEMAYSGDPQLRIVYYGYVPGPSPGQSGWRKFDLNRPAPVGRWFEIRSRIHQGNNYDGRVTYWIDGELVFDRDGVTTSYANCAFNAWCTSNEWAVNSYSDGMSPTPATIYVDDAQLSLP